MLCTLMHSVEYMRRIQNSLTHGVCVMCFRSFVEDSVEYMRRLWMQLKRFSSASVSTSASTDCATADMMHLLLKERSRQYGAWILAYFGVQRSASKNRTLAEMMPILWQLQTAKQSVWMRGMLSWRFWRLQQMSHSKDEDSEIFSQHASVEL